MDQYGKIIAQSTLIREILFVLPDAGRLLARYGIHCASCVFNASETLGEGMERHRLTKEDTEDLLNDLYILVQELPQKPHTMALTKDAAILLKNITSASGSPPTCAIIVDEQQKLTLETICHGSTTLTMTHKCFSNPDVPEVRIFVSPFLLLHVGGAEISVKEGRLRIDLPVKEKVCCQTTDTCSCVHKGGVARHCLW